MRGRAHRAWLLLPAGLSLLAGIDAGLLLLQVPAPVGAAHLPDVHGPLMVLGFLGTLIALERAVALRTALGYAAPALLGLGGLALAAGLPRTIGQVLLLDGAVALVAVLVALWRRRRDDPVMVEVLGASLAVLAALLWVRVDAAVVVPLLAGFVVLTIAAERVELARIHLPASAERVLVSVAALVASAAMAAVLFPDPGSRAFGLSLLVLVAWLAPRDVARRTVHSTGQPRFCAAAMLAGYAWLAVAGVAWAVSGVTTTPAAHDVVVHTIFLGFRHEHGAGPRPGHPARGAAPPGALPARCSGCPSSCCTRRCSCGWPVTSPAVPCWWRSGATAPPPPCCSCPWPPCSPPPSRHRCPRAAAHRHPPARAVLTASTWSPP